MRNRDQRIATTTRTPAAAATTTAFFPRTPPCHKDRLFEDLKKYTRSPRATQLMPVYREFRLGHGDPLMAAVMKHWNDMAYHPAKKKSEEISAPLEVTTTTTGGSNNIKGLECIPRLSSAESTETDDDDDVKEIHLIQHGSPLGGLAGNDTITEIEVTYIAPLCTKPGFLSLF